MKIEHRTFNFHDFMHLKKRESLVERIKFCFTVNPVVALLGLRQCGKTTLAHMYIDQQPSVPFIHYFDLEDLEDFALFEHPKLTLAPLKRSKRV